ncbi:hypothetical protein SAMN04487776_103124 [Priestia megaterium]|nr:hypothetical protein SAMN04487776_103124 [Priestia megaterium]
MKFGLLENGLDSLKMGINFYDKYIKALTSQNASQSTDFEKDSYLKLAVICVQNSVEILSKKILSDINDFLIYKDIDKLVDELSQKDNPEVVFHDYLIEKDRSIETISYSLCIERLEKLYKREIPKGQIQALIDIGYERNKLTHFGISKSLDYHKSIGLIHRALQFIDEFVLDKLECDIETLREKVTTVRHLGKLAEESEWSKSTSEKFQYLETELAASCAKLEAENPELGFNIEENTFYLDIPVEGNTLSIESIILPHLDSVTFVLKNDNKDYILAIVDFSIEDNIIYVCKRPHNEIFSQYINKKNWLGNHKLYDRRILDEQQLEFILRDFKKITLVED